MRLVLLWAIGFSARVTLLAVPPLIPAMHRDLTLDETSVGALTGLPVILLSVGAVAGSLVIARLGARRAAILGLAIVGVAGALRGLGPSIPWLFATTIVMGVGVALAQIAMPSLVAAWEQHNVGRATAAYGNGMLMGEIVGSSLTATVLVGIAGLSWEVALAVWSVPVLVVVFALAFQPEIVAPLEPMRWWPAWRDRRAWTIALVLGASSLAYWGSNAQLPDYLHATGHGDDVATALTSLNALQLPSSLLVGLWPAVFVARRWPFAAAGVITTGGAVGLMVMNGAASGVWAGGIGLVSALVFVLGLALPPLMAAPEDVHRLSASIFTISYAFAFVGPVIAGALWDATHAPAMALVPTAIAGVLLMALASRLDVRPTRRA